jgi:hypothetical protein
MLWARLLAYVTGTVHQELLILRGQIRGRLLLSDGEKVTLAEIAHRLGRMALEGCRYLLPSVPVLSSIGIEQRVLAQGSDRDQFFDHTG